MPVLRAILKNSKNGKPCETHKVAVWLFVLNIQIIRSKNGGFAPRPQELSLFLSAFAVENNPIISSAIGY